MKNRTLLVLTSIIFLFSTTTKAQDNTAFEKGTVVVTAGYGFPDFYRNSLRSAYVGYKTSKVTGFGPIILKGDYGIVKFKWGHSVGAGIVLGYSSSHVDFSDTKYTTSVYVGEALYRTITIGARGSYHFFTKEKFDCYVSLGAGFNINSYIENSTGGYSYSGSYYGTTRIASRSQLYELATVGIRYYFTKNIGVYSELGWDMSAPIQGGIALKF